jgi:putative SOS response-associated peptidase YedK
VPRWARNLDGPKPINARSDSVMAKPMFRDAIRHRRCLIPVDGFFEWHREGGRKQPYYFRMVDRVPFALGGMWECAVRRHGRSAGANPARQLSLQPVAIGAVVEVTKRLKPSMERVV